MGRAFEHLITERRKCGHLFQWKAVKLRRRRLVKTGSLQEYIYFNVLKVLTKQPKQPKQTSQAQTCTPRNNTNASDQTDRR